MNFPEDSTQARIRVILFENLHLTPFRNKRATLRAQNSRKSQKLRHKFKFKQFLFDCTSDKLWLCLCNGMKVLNSWSHDTL